MKVIGQLERAQIENLGADPAGADLVKGRIWFNTASGIYKYYDGTSVRSITGDALAAEMTTTGTGSIVATASAANADTLVGKVTATGANAAAAAMNTTGTGSIVSTMSAANTDTIAGKFTTTGTGSIVATASAANANTLLQKVTTSNSTASNAIRDAATRSTGTSVSAGGVAISSSSGAFSTGSTTYTDVTNLSVTIITSGRPVVVQLVPDAGGGLSELNVSSTAVSANLQVKFLRGATDVGQLELGFSDAAAATKDLYIPISSVQTLDAVAAGTYTYKLQVKAGTAGMTAIVQNCKLIAYEL